MIYVWKLVKSLSHVRLFATPWTVAHQASLSMGFSRQEYWKPARLLCPWDSPGKNTVVGCHFLLQRIFLTQKSNWGLLHCRQVLYQLSCEGSPQEHGVNQKEDKDLKILCWSLPIFFKTKKFLQISTHKVKTVYKYIRPCLSLCLNRQDKQCSSWVRNSSRDPVMNDR